MYKKSIFFVDDKITIRNVLTFKRILENGIMIYIFRENVKKYLAMYMSATVGEWLGLIPVLFRIFSFYNIKKHKLLCTGMCSQGVSIYLINIIE